MASNYVHAIVYRIYEDKKYIVTAVTDDIVEMIPCDRYNYRKLVVDKSDFIDKEKFEIVTPGPSRVEG